MKKVILGLMAVALTFSAIAQTTDNSADNKSWKKKEFGKKRFKDRENFDKLNLTDAQKAQIKSINESFKQQMKDLNKQGSITVDQQKQKREALLSDHKAKIAAVLTPEQRQQAESATKDFRQGRDAGPRDRFEDLKDLNLTQDQSAKMATINSTFKTKLQEVRQNASLTKDEKREQMKNLMKQHKSDLEALLTADQKEQIKSRQKSRRNITAVK